jgi:hypothetical protein
LCVYFKGVYSSNRYLGTLSIQLDMFYFQNMRGEIYNYKTST